MCAHAISLDAGNLLVDSPPKVTWREGLWRIQLVVSPVDHVHPSVSVSALSRFDRKSNVCLLNLCTDTCLTAY